MIKFIKLNWSYFLVGAIGGVIAVALILLVQHAMNWVESLKIFISILALFCTFLGAYLGAKISGDNALKIANRDIETSEFKIAWFLSKAENKYLSLKIKSNWKKVMKNL